MCTHNVSMLPPMFTRIDHIGIAVEDLDAAIGLYERDYEMELVHRETVTEQGVEAVLLEGGGHRIQDGQDARQRPEQTGQPGVELSGGDSQHAAAACFSRPSWECW